MDFCNATSVPDSCLIWPRHYECFVRMIVRHFWHRRCFQTWMTMMDSTPKEVLSVNENRKNIVNSVYTPYLAHDDQCPFRSWERATIFTGFLSDRYWLIVPWQLLIHVSISQFPVNFKLILVFDGCPQNNFTLPCWWLINFGSGNELLVGDIVDPVLCHHVASLGQNKLTYNWCITCKTRHWTSQRA